MAGTSPGYSIAVRVEAPQTFGATTELASAYPGPAARCRSPPPHAAIVATGRSDFPNQINNVLAFPAFFRGMLDAGTHQITDAAMIAAATAIADCVGSAQLNANYIVPSVFDPHVAPAVAAAVEAAAAESVAG